MHDQTLFMLANEVRGKTLRLLDGVTPEEARFAGGGALNNSILWHAGHAVVVVERLCISAATGGSPPQPPAWRETFGPKSLPGAVTDWPSVGTVVAALEEQLVRLRDVIRNAHPERMDQVIDAERNRTLRYSILHGLHDEANHQGEMYLLKKTWARRG